MLAASANQADSDSLDERRRAADQSHLFKTLLPRFREIKTPGDVTLVMFHVGKGLSLKQARDMTRWADSERLDFVCGRDNFAADGASRSCYVLTDNEQARGHFASLAAKAGRCLGSWSLAAGISPETLTVGHATRWMFALFDLALAERLPIEAKRYFLHPTAATQSGLRSIYAFHPAKSDTDRQRLEEEIRAAEELGFHSDLQDAVETSCYAIKYLATAASDVQELPAGPATAPVASDDADLSLASTLAATLAVVQVGAPDLKADIDFARDDSRPVPERLETVFRRNTHYHHWTQEALAKLCCCSRSSIWKAIRDSEFLQKCRRRDDR